MRQGSLLSSVVWCVGVSLWPHTDAIGTLNLGRNLTIWVHTTANFSTDTTKVMCAQKVYLVMTFETYRHCMNLTAGVTYQYVTIQRFAATASGLALMEARIYGSCELCSWRLALPDLRSA